LTRLKNTAAPPRSFARFDNRSVLQRDAIDCRFDRRVDQFYHEHDARHHHRLADAAYVEHQRDENQQRGKGRLLTKSFLVPKRRCETVHCDPSRTSLDGYRDVDESLKDIALTSY